MGAAYATLLAVDETSAPSGVEVRAAGGPSGASRLVLEALVPAAASGDRDAVGRLLRGLGPTLLRVCCGVMGERSPQLEDVVQESLVALADALPAFRGESGIVHYASRIAVRTALSARRTQARRHALAPTLSTDAEPVGVDEDSPYQGTSQHSPEDAARASRRRDALRQILADLSEAHAQALTLRIVMGYSIEEMAETTGVPVNTVRSRLIHAKRALRDRVLEDPTLATLLEVSP